MRRHGPRYLGRLDNLLTNLRKIRAEVGAKGGRQRSPEQTAARKLNMLKALSKRFPNSVKIAQQLAEITRPVQMYIRVKCPNCDEFLTFNHPMKDGVNIGTCTNPKCLTGIWKIDFRTGIGTIE